MTILSALKKLHKKMTGQETNSKTIGGVLDSMQENYSGGGSSSDTYEIVLEMQLGEPITDEGIPEWATAFDVSDYETEIRSLAGERIPIFISSDGYKYGEKIELVYDDDNWTKNCTASAQGITWDDPNEDCFVLLKAGFIFGSNVNFSNTTVRILKKVFGGSSITVDSALSDTSENPVQNKVITEVMNDSKSLIVHGSVDALNSTAEITDDISLADLYSAAIRGVFVAFECALGKGNTTRLALAGYTLANEEYSFSFSVSSIQAGKPACILVEFENNKTGTFELAISA